MGYFKRLTAIACLVVCAIPLHAAPVLQITGGVLTGAKGVEVSGVLYDVEFKDGTCVALFSGCNQVSDFVFQSQVAAAAAAQALLNSVFLDSAFGQFDSQPALTNGCSNASQCLANIPFETDGLSVLGSAAGNMVLEGSDSLWNSNTDIDFGTAAINYFTYAIFSRAAIAIPEPGSLALIGLGFAALIAVRKRKQN
jgi:hypothetical protein